MSARIQKHLLTLDQLKAIKQFLSLQPKSSSFTTPSFVKPPDPLLFYQLEHEDIILPFSFYRALTKKEPNINRTYPGVSFNFTGSLRDEQLPIAQECLEQLQKHGTTTLVVPPGFGKTVIGAYLNSQLTLQKSNKQPLALILFHREILCPQWISTYNDFTDAKLWVIGKKLPSEFNVILCMDSQFKNLPDEIRTKIGCLIIDEAHAFCTRGHLTHWLSIEPQYIITLTATPERDDGMHSILEAVCGLHRVARLSTKPFKVFRFPTGITPEKKLNNQGTLDWNYTTNQLCTNRLRNEYILGFVQDNPEFKILILTWRQAHAFTLHQYLIEHKISAAVMAGNRHTYSDSRVLVGTIAKIGTGFDEKTACSDFAGQRINLLLLVGSTKSDKVIEQTVGRVFRSDSPHVVVFVDNVPAIKRHWSIFKKWAVTRNATVFDLKNPSAYEPEEVSTSIIEKLAQAQLASLNKS